MSKWEQNGKSNDWYTPDYVFKALGVRFDMDVAAPAGGIGTHVPADEFISENSIQSAWSGFVWMNPPFGGRNEIAPWLRKFFEHGDGIALAPDRTSATWWQEAAMKSDAVLFVHKKK